MEAKRILPVLGGTASVWTACLLFFQFALLAGYAYAAVASRWVHLTFLAVAAVASWIAPVNTFYYFDQSSSIPLAVATWLAVLTGLPFVAISAGSVLLQRWAGSYRLYAFSNAGSLAGLFAYPLVIEPWFDLTRQRELWLAGAAVYAVLMAVCAFRATDVARASWGRRPSLANIALWIGLAACGTGLLAAATNQICQEVASLPFLWVLPLALYLVTFILVFAQRDRWWNRPGTVWNLAAAVLIPVAVMLYVLGLQTSFLWHVAVDLAVLFVCLMICHGHLAARRPEAGSMGWFYLAMSAGGVLGTLFPAIVAPAVFTTYAEFPLLLGATALAAILLLPRPLFPLTMRRRFELFGLAAAAFAPAAALAPPTVPPLYQSRNFYGVLRVTEHKQPQGTLRLLMHGQTVHGTQWLEHPDWPTSYYGETSGVSKAIVEEQRLRSKGVDVVVVGLGAGTIAHYARPQDNFRFYELNPDVEYVARQYFRYLSKPGVNPHVELGDARHSLGQDDVTWQADLLIIDAFSSDSIPVHLLTREAAQVYSSRTKPEGSILFHISNRTMNLEPVVRGLARFLNRRVEIFRSNDEPATGASSAVWIRLRPGAYEGPPGLLWTDSYSSLWPLLRLR